MGNWWEECFEWSDNRTTTRIMCGFSLKIFVRIFLFSNSEWCDSFRIEAPSFWSSHTLRMVWTKQGKRKYSQHVHTLYNTNCVVILVLTCLAMRYNFAFLMCFFFLLILRIFNSSKRETVINCANIYTHAFWILIRANKTHCRHIHQLAIA